MFFIVKNAIFNLLGALRILQNFWPDERVMYSVCALLLDPNFGVRLMADKKFYLRLTVEKMHALVVFTEKYLRSKGFSSGNDTASRKTNLLCNNHKKIFLLFNGKPACSQLLDLLINFRLPQPL